MRSNRVRLAALVLAFAAVLAACGGSTDATGSSDAPGSSDAAPSDDASGAGDAPAAFTADQLGGGEVTSASFAGQDTVLWFWAPWCTVCRGEADDVVAAADALSGRVELIGVAGRGEVPEMEDFVDDTGTGGLTHLVDADGSIWSSYEVVAQPAFAFIDDSGEVEVVVGTLGQDALVERMTAMAEA